MKYEEAIHWLMNDLPFFQQQGQSSYNPGLDRIRELCNHLGNPQERFKSIHIAGTNGKGSTSHMLASIFQEHNFKVGLHTSPHLMELEERNRINGENTNKEFVRDFITENKDFITELNCSFFEVVLALGFSYFAQNKVDIAIIETGLGGRLDATNILNPVLSIITNIALEHTNILGDTMAQIAFEKAGIIKPEIPIVIGEFNDETQPIFEQISSEKKAKIYFTNLNTPPLFTTDLKGEYQKKNLKTVEKAIEVLSLNGFHFNKEKIQIALNNVTATTGLRGRWETLGRKPLIIVDTAHNPAGFKELITQINKVQADSKFMILGFVKDKDIKSILNILPKEVEYFFCQPNIDRRLNINDLKKLTPKTLKSNYFNSVKEAIISAKQQATANDFIFIGGSNFVVSEAIQVLSKK